MTFFRHAGFTLMEMLVVIGILGLATGIGYPLVSRAIDTQLFVTATAQVDLAVRQTRADAIRRHQTVEVTRFASGNGPATVSLYKGRIDPKIRVTQPERIRFFADGTSTGGTIILSLKPRIFRIVVEPQTGIIIASRQ